LLIFGDYDVDGVTSTAMLLRALRALGANVTARIPERHEGYGLSVAAVEKAAEDGISLILRRLTVPASLALMLSSPITTILGRNCPWHSPL